MINSQQSIIILGISMMVIAIYLRSLILNQEQQLQNNKYQIQKLEISNKENHNHNHNHIYKENIKHRRLENRLLPPERTYNSGKIYIEPDHTHKHVKAIPIGIHTRGIPPKYQQVGVLVNNEGSEPLIFPLYGRPLWNGSSKWNYYTSTNQYHSIKVTVEKNSRDCLNQIGCDELYDGDTIKIPVYGDSKEFTATIYQVDSPKYIPYIV